jgi:3-hydroxyisobutyrate dehydrogenase-like beta-hydroxyacid dehydrogenase
VLGRAFAGLLSRAGVDCAVYDVSDEALAAARHEGLDTAASPAELAARCRLVSVTVRDDAETLAATCSSDGVLAGGHADLLLALHSTIHPETVRQVSAQAEAGEIAVVEAPVVGRPAVIEAGDSVFLVGGETASIERATPYLLAIGRQAVPVGPLGSANVAKLMANLLKGAERLVLHEALQLGEAHGIEYVRALELLQALQAGQPTLLDRWPDAFDASGASSAPRTENLHFFDKDIPLAAVLGRAAGASLPITEQVAAAGLALIAPAPEVR